MQELTPFSTPETVNTYGVLPHQPGIELDLEHADVYFSETVILDENAKPIEREIGEPKPKGTPLEEVGKNPEEFSANFSQEYISYKQRVLEEDGSKEYVSYIEHQAKKIIKEKKLEIIKPATFVCIPTRNEEATSQSVAVAMDSLNQNSFCLVNHNFVTVPDQSVVDDIETIKKREDTQVIEGFARSNLGDARGLITDIACEIAYQLGVDEPIIISSDADVREVNQDDGYQQAIDALLAQEERLIAYGNLLYSYDESRPNMSKILALRNAISSVKFMKQLSRSGDMSSPTGAFYAFKASAYCYTGGYSRLTYGEDIVLESKMSKANGQEKKVARFELRDLFIYKDGSNSVFFNKGKYGTAADFFEVAKLNRAKIVDISLSEFYKMKINVLNKLTDSISFSKFGAINQEEIFKVIDQYLSPSDRMYIKIRLLYKKVSGKI